MKAAQRDQQCSTAAWLREFSAHICVGLLLLVIGFSTWIVTKTYAQENKLDVEIKTQEVKHVNIDEVNNEIKERLKRIESKVDKVLEKP